MADPKDLGVGFYRDMGTTRKKAGMTEMQMGQAKINHRMAAGRAALETAPGKRTPSQKADIEAFGMLGSPAEREIRRANAKHRK